MITAFYCFPLAIYFFKKNRMNLIRDIYLYLKEGGEMSIFGILIKK